MKSLQDFGSFEEYVRESSKPMIPIGTPVSLVYSLLPVSNALGGEVGELQNIVKKMLRDGSTGTLHKEFIEEAGDVLHYLTRLIGFFGLTLESIEEANVSKLEQRRRDAAIDTARAQAQL